MRNDEPEKNDVEVRIIMLVNVADRACLRVCVLLASLCNAARDAVSVLLPTRSSILRS